MNTLKVGVCLSAALLLCGCNPLMSASLNNLKAAVVGPDEVDVSAAEVAGVNYPQGPLAWADRIGLALITRVLDNVQASYGEERYRPSLLLRRRAISTAAAAPIPRPPRPSSLPPPC